MCAKINFILICITFWALDVYMSTVVMNTVKCHFIYRRNVVTRLCEKTQ